jgi:hypothetical protein
LRWSGAKAGAQIATYIYEGHKSSPDVSSRSNSDPVAEMSGVFRSLLRNRNWNRNFTFNSSSDQDVSCDFVHCLFMFFECEKFNATTRKFMSEQYLMLFRGTNWEKGLSPQEIQNIMKRWVEWNDRLIKEGKIKAAQPLVAEGKIISGKKKRVISDGPFAESKEAIAGYFLLEVKDLDEAVAIGNGCPTLDYGTIVEVRPVAVIENEKLSPALRLYLESMAELNKD